MVLWFAKNEFVAWKTMESSTPMKKKETERRKVEKDGTFDDHDDQKSCKDQGFGT